MNRSTIILIASIILAMVISFFVGERYGTKKGIDYLEPDTVYLDRWIHDTIYEPKDSIIYETITAYLPVHDTTRDTTTLVKVDSILVDVPIWEKSYVSENYHLTIRGFQPELVDVWIRQKETFIKVPYRKRWSFTVGPQAGIGITPEGVQPYAGGGITFGYTF